MTEINRYFAAGKYHKNLAKESIIENTKNRRRIEAIYYDHEFYSSNTHRKLKGSYKIIKVLDNLFVTKVGNRIFPTASETSSKLITFNNLDYFAPIYYTTDGILFYDGYKTKEVALEELSRMKKYVRI
jgi:hypothetical protein